MTPAQDNEQRVDRARQRLQALTQELYQSQGRLAELARQQELTAAELAEAELAEAEQGEAEQGGAHPGDGATPVRVGTLVTQAAALLGGPIPAGDMASVLAELQQRLARAREELAVRKGQVQRILSDQEEHTAALAQAQAQAEVLEKVALLLQQTAGHARTQAKERIERLVTSTLQAVFGPEYGFRIDLTEKAGRSEAEFYVLSPVGGEVVATRPQEARGGGVVDLVSLGLRIAMLETYQPRLEGALILDEPAKHVSEEYIESTARFFRTVSESFGRQVIMVTHNTHLTGTADRVYQVVLKDEKSHVHRST